MTDRRIENARRKATGSPGLRTLRRPAVEGSPEFDLAYTRTGPSDGVPVVVLPGGPGLASILPYRQFRARAAKHGIHTIMIEHRGIGLSRCDTNGNPLPASAISIMLAVDDIEAVLAAEEISEAIVYGSSYGTYLAAGFGIAHPERVAGMILDSVVLSAEDHHIVRSHCRSLLWDGDAPELADCARLLRSLVTAGFDQDQASDVARIVYEFGGRALLRRVLTQAATGRAIQTWKFVTRIGNSEIGDDIASPYVMEFGPVGQIAFTELNYAPTPDGKPFDPATQFAAAAEKYPDFAREPFDVRGSMAQFDWPTTIILGARDLRTPPPIAELAAALLPDVRVVKLDNGHSALDTHQLAALHVIGRMAGRDGARLDTAEDQAVIAALPHRGSAVRFLPHIISFALRWDHAVSAVRVRLSRWLRSRNHTTTQ